MMANIPRCLLLLGTMLECVSERARGAIQKNPTFLLAYIFHEINSSVGHKQNMLETCAAAVPCVHGVWAERRRTCSAEKTLPHWS